jgi:hypothetical protein
MSPVRSVAVVVGAAICLAVAGCGRTDPAEELRRMVAIAEEAAEAGEVEVLVGLLSEEFGDTDGRDRRSFAALMRGYLGGRKLHLLTRIGSVAVPESTRGELTVFVALAARPIENVRALDRLQADLYRVELRCRREQETWKIAGAEWRAAELLNFM